MRQPVDISPPSPPAAESDVVVRELRHVEHRYQEIRDEADEQRRYLAEERQRAEELAAETARLQVALAEMERRSEASERRNRELARHVREVHRALYQGDLYDLILEACLQLTGATRGLYLSCRYDGEQLRVRAAHGVTAAVGDGVDSFIDGLAKRTLQSMDAVVCSRQQMNGSESEEAFANCAAVPVVALHDLGGVVIVADKTEGEFDQEDLQALLSVGSHSSVAVENLRLQRQLQHAYLATLSMLADVVEAKDPSTRGHCELVSRFARLTAHQLGLDRRQTSLACYGALLHDVGKIAVSDGVLNKPGPLLAEERDLVRAHVRVGHDLLKRVPALADVAEVVLAHHERFDGGGYPAGLQGDGIPLPARIVAVVDAYCAMITKRSYKEAFADEAARVELRRCAGGQFDPRVVDAFLEALDTPAGRAPVEVDDAVECGLLPAFPAARKEGSGGAAQS
ncbi:MAG TPA: HD domain-containing phosphohydrolase [Thermoanaerobaculia bacterium]|jgi:putative nucleotidyltransferase with HDIG domain|nr:HD domain-containing phosphohydrolase [Thermoanaerobaculia bacterium]